MTVGLIVAGVLGLFLVIVIILGTLKYRQTKVQFFYKIRDVYRVAPGSHERFLLVHAPSQLQKERDLMQGELDEFMLGDPAAASVAPDGVDRALLLPFTKVIPPEDIIVGKALLMPVFTIPSICNTPSHY